MAITLDTKAPGERIAYLWTPPLASGDSISGTPTATRLTGTASTDGISVVSGQVKIWMTGGADGEIASFLVQAATTGGETLQETLYLPIESSALSTLAATLASIFPAFAGVSQPAIDYWLDRAAEVTGSWENDHATMLLACHYMTINGLGTGTAAEMASNGMSGVKSIRSGALSVDFGEEAASSAAKGGFQSTSYGRQFLPIARSHLGGPMVASTGVLNFTREGYPWPS